MNALSLYVTTCRMVFQADIDNAAAWADINRLIMYLRQALTCLVCGQLLKIPMSSSVASCQHHVCKSCIGGKMRLKPSCSWCKDYSKFIENIQLRILLQCYKRLSIYIKRSDISKKYWSLQAANTPGVLIGSSANSIYNQNNCPSNFKELIDEGSNLPDKYTFFEPPSLRNLNNHKSNTQSSNLNQTLNSNSSLDNLEQKSSSYQTLNSSSNLKNVLLDKKDDHLIGKQTSIIHSTTIVTDNSYQNQLIDNSLNNHQSNSLGNSLNSSINQTNNNASSITPTKTKPHKVRKGCRCGLATLNPGKLTCCGQRCCCYVEGKACFECKCRGCRNPNKSGQKQNETTNKHNNNMNNLITNRTSPGSPILITTSSAINISTNNSSNLISTSPNLFTSSSLNSNNNQTALLSSTASSTRNLLSPSFLLSSSNTPSSTTLISASNANQMLRNSGNIFQTGTKFNIISSTSSPSAAIFLGHHNSVGNSVSTVGVDSLTLPFPNIEDQVILSENVCIEEDPSSLHQSIGEIITVHENDEI